MQADGRQRFALPRRHEQIFAGAVGERLMQMPAAGVIALECGPRHEGRKMAHAPADLPRGAAEQDEIVGGFERTARCECAFHLARPPFVFDRAQRQIDRLEMRGKRRQHRLHQVEIGFGVIGIAGLCGQRANRLSAQAGDADILLAEPVVGKAQQIPFHFEPDDEVLFLRLQARKLLLQQLPRRKMKRNAGVEIFVAQDPADTRRPGQHTKCRRIGHNGQVGRARHLVETHATARRERGECARARGVERGGRHIDVVAVRQRGGEGGHGNFLGTRMAVGVRPDEADQPQFVCPHALQQVGRAAFLLGGPQTVPFDEGGRYPCPGLSGFAGSVKHVGPSRVRIGVKYTPLRPTAAPGQPGSVESFSEIDID